MSNLGGFLNTVKKRTIGFLNDIEAKGIPPLPSYNEILLRKYLEGELQNPIMATTRRPAYRAIVSPTAGGTDFTDIQKAVDYVNELGGGTILIKSGTFSLTTDITLYENITLQGENPSTAIIDFGDTAKSIKAVSGGDRPNMGTISISYNSKIITGVDTLWVNGGGEDEWPANNLNAGDWIRLNNIWYQIDTVDSDTQCTLLETYLGNGISGASYQAGTMLQDIRVIGLTILRNTGVAGTNRGIDFQYIRNAVVKDVICRMRTGWGVYLSVCPNPIVSECVMNSCGGGVLIDSCNNSLIFSNEISNGGSSSGVGVQSNSQGTIVLGNDISTNSTGSLAAIYVAFTQEVRVISNNIIGNKVDAIQLRGSNRCIISNNYVYDNGAKGINIGDTGWGGDNNIVVGNIFNNNDRGIFIGTSSCDKNIITSNVALSNTTANYTDNGTGTVAANNVTS